jgi:hypothetical protein
VESNQTLIQNGAKSAEVAAKELRKRFIEDLPKGLRTPQQDLEFRKIEQDLFRQETETKLGRIESAKGALTPFADNPYFSTEKQVKEVQRLEEEAFKTRRDDAQRYYDYIKNQDGVLEADKKAALNELTKTEREYYSVQLKNEVDFINRRYSLFQEGLAKQKAALDASRNDEFFFNPQKNELGRTLERDALESEVERTKAVYDQLLKTEGVSQQARLNARADYEKAKSDLIQKGYRDEQDRTQENIRKIEALESIGINALRENRLTARGDITERILRKEEELRSRVLQEELAGLERIKAAGVKNKEELLAIEAQIAAKRVEIVENYVNQAIRQLDRLSKNADARLVEARAGEGNTGIRLDNRSRVLEAQGQAYDQGSRVLDIALSAREKDFEFAQGLTKEETKRLNLADQLLRIKQETLNAQIKNEQRTLEIQRQQLDVQFQQMELQQRRSELEATTNFEKSLIEREKTYLDPNATEADKRIADANARIAEIDVEGAILGRSLLETEKVIKTNEQRMREYEQAVSARTRQDDINAQRAAIRDGRSNIGLKEGQDPSTREQEAEAIRRLNRRQIAIPQLNVPLGNVDEGAIRTIIDKIANDAQLSIDQIKAKAEEQIKNINDPTKAKVSTLTESLGQQQLNVQEQMLTELRQMNGKKPIEKKSLTTEGKKEQPIKPPDNKVPPGGIVNLRPGENGVFGAPPYKTRFGGQSNGKPLTEFDRIPDIIKQLAINPVNSTFYQGFKNGKGGFMDKDGKGESLSPMLKDYLYDEATKQNKQVNSSTTKRLSVVEQNYLRIEKEYNDYFNKGKNIPEDTNKAFIDWANKTNTPYFKNEIGQISPQTKAGQDKYTELYQAQKDKVYGKDNWGVKSLELDAKLMDAKTLLYQERGEKQKADYLKQMRGQVQYGIADQLKKVKPEDAQKQDPKKVNTVSFNPNITINVATKDGEVGETLKAQLNDQLYSIFNETIRSLDT